MSQREEWEGEISRVSVVRRKGRISKTFPSNFSRKGKVYSCKVKRTCWFFFYKGYQCRNIGKILARMRQNIAFPEMWIIEAKNQTKIYSYVKVNKSYSGLCVPNTHQQSNGPKTIGLRGGSPTQTALIEPWWSLDSPCTLSLMDDIISS